MDALVCKASISDITAAFDNYVHQAIDLTCSIRVTNAPIDRQKGPKWYDRELRLNCSSALKGGENEYKEVENGNIVALCREYRSTKQRKYKRNCLESIKCAYKNDKHSMWGVLKDVDRNDKITVELSDAQFYEYFKDISSANDSDYFNAKCEHGALLFLKEYTNHKPCNYDSDLEKFFINQNFSTGDIKSAIDALKNNKSPGIDAIPAEFVKHCKDILAEDISMALNYVIEEQSFSDNWAKGLRPVVFKSGKHDIVSNYRGITILPNMGIFELAVYRRLAFAK